MMMKDMNRKQDCRRKGNDGDPENGRKDAVAYLILSDLSIRLDQMMLNQPLLHSSLVHRGRKSEEKKEEEKEKGSMSVSINALIRFV